MADCSEGGNLSVGMVRFGDMMSILVVMLNKVWSVCMEYEYYLVRELVQWMELAEIVANHRDALKHPWIAGTAATTPPA